MKSSYRLLMMTAAMLGVAGSSLLAPAASNEGQKYDSYASNKKPSEPTQSDLLALRRAEEKRKRRADRRAGK